MRRKQSQHRRAEKENRGETTNQPHEAGKEKSASRGSTPEQIPALSWTPYSSWSPKQSSVAAKLPGLSVGHCQACFGHLKPSRHLRFSWRGWSSGCPSAVLRARLYILHPTPTPNSSDAALHTSTVCSDCQTSPVPTPGSVFLPLPTRVHELHTFQSFGISYRNWSLQACFCWHLPLYFSPTAERTHVLQV